MQVTFDGIGTIQTTVTPPAAPAAPEVGAPAPRTRGRGQRRNGTGEGGASKQSFRAALSSAENGVRSGLTATFAGRTAPAEPQPRSTRLPSAQPTEIDVADGVEIFRQSRQVATEDAAVPESRVGFGEAASRYAERFFSLATTFAKPGEKLEIQA